MASVDRLLTRGLESYPDSNPRHAGSRHRYILASLLLTAALVILPGNADRLLNGHEILVAQTATEMMARDDLLEPFVLGEPRLQKPPLSYWLSIGIHKLLGGADDEHVSEFEARLPSILSGLLLLLVTYGIGRQLVGSPQGGLVSAGLIASCFPFFLYARSARAEMLYTLLCALMVFGLLLALRRTEKGLSSTGAAAVAWSAFGLALFAKGPQFPIFILLGFLLALSLRRPRPPLLAILHPWMALPAVALPLAYFAYLVWQVDDALSVWSTELVQGVHVPLWLRPLRFYYPAILIVGLLPWIVALGYTVVDTCKRREPAALVLASCVLVSLLMVSFAGKLRAHYVLPLLPLCTALMAGSLLRLRLACGEEKLPSRIDRFLAWSQFALVGATIAAVTIYLLNRDIAGTLAGVLPWMTVSGVLYMVSAAAMKRYPGRSFAALVGTVLFACAGFAQLGVDTFEKSVAFHRFIEQAESRVPEQATVIYDFGEPLLFSYYARHDFEVLPLEAWGKSGRIEPGTYIIASLERIRKNRIPGEVLVETPLGKGEVVVLFRPGEADRPDAPE
ncbi:MAG: glycosyltransferase family 39 protein [Gammaproteobacteria bacterium]